MRELEEANVLLMSGPLWDHIKKYARCNTRIYDAFFISFFCGLVSRSKSSRVHFSTSKHQRIKYCYVAAGQARRCIYMSTATALARTVPLYSFFVAVLMAHSISIPGHSLHCPVHVHVRMHAARRSNSDVWSALLLYPVIRSRCSSSCHSSP